MRTISTGLNLTADTLTTVYTVPTGYYAKCTLLRANNSSASNKHVSFNWYDYSTSTNVSILYQYTINSKSSLNEIDANKYFILEEGDYLTTQSEAGSTMSVVVTLELYRKGE